MFGFLAFSILDRIALVETSYLEHLFTETMAFSILDRIALVETPPVAVLLLVILAFQYPRSDRIG